ncbi:MAG: hypothetical protein ACE5J7_04250 [Candidatus Aenigmatarchaeota archaeon]
MSSRAFALGVTLAAMLGIGAVSALVATYGSITGYALVVSSISFEIIESYSDVNYSATEGNHYELWDPHQGEVKWVDLKITNDADTSLPLIINVTPSKSDIGVTLWNYDKSQQLSNPITASPGNTYVYIKHIINSAAETGNYTFQIDILPG